VQALNESIAEQRSELLEVMRLGTELRQLAVGDDVKQLDSELEMLRDRYTRLSDTSDHRLSRMMEVSVVLKRFLTSHETIVELVSLLDVELGEKDIQIQPGPEAELHLQVSFDSLPWHCCSYCSRISF